MKFKMAPGNKFVKIFMIALIGFYDPENLDIGKISFSGGGHFEMALKTVNRVCARGSPSNIT